jgi:hypothetical protein
VVLASSAHGIPHRTWKNSTSSTNDFPAYSARVSRPHTVFYGHLIFYCHGA